ncbi:MAG TPA: PQQ-dependent sugar dehydrogenase [Candidatus Limnocylindrales bacterium]|nr:PQQ-dependent sugar dehydrogenase [Candidatus Limnocylindrales bacterium]
MIRPVTVPTLHASRAIRAALLCATLVAGLLPASASAATVPVPLTDGGLAAAPTGSTIRLVKVADVPNPVMAIGSRDGTGRLFIVSQGGRIRILKNGTLLTTPFLNISTAVSTGGEQGLLGLAFHPSFRTNRKLYVNYTNTAGDTVIREYRASASNPDVVQSGSGRTILRIAQPYSNHNGGMLAFGRDGYLYIGMGDGGDGGDPGNRAQNLDSLLGKMLRINVNGRTSTRGYLIPSSNPYVGKAGRNEIWQRGLRNPWRFSFDRSTGDLWIGDVGQGRYEEVDRAVRTASGPGKAVNWGWRVMEGNHCYRPSAGCNTTGKRRPLVEYSHAATGGCAVTGGYVYRGSAIPALRGWYVYGDFCGGQVWGVSSGASRPATPVKLLSTGRSVSGFGEDNAGELYLCDLNGAVYKIVAG